MRFVVCAGLLWAASVSAQAQASAPVAGPDFPPDAKPLAAESLRDRLSDKVFHVALADGGSWRLQYRGSGQFFINTSSGFADSGKWWVDGTKLCSERSRTKPSCNDARLVGEAIYLKRDSGEIVQFEPK